MKLTRFVITLLLMASVTTPPAANAQRRGRAARGGAGGNAADSIVSGATVVTMDGARRVIEDGSIAVKGGRIVAVGPRAEVESKYTARERVDARGKVVIPGLINGHTHVPMTLFRGLADDLDLNEWLTRYIFPAEAKNVTEEFVRVGTRLGLAEMIRGGTTTYCDMYYFEDAIADETAKAGVRGVLGETVIDFPVADNKTWAEAMAYTDKFLAKWKGHALVVPAVAPHAPYTVSEEHLKEVRALSDKHNSPIVTHVSETRKEVEDITKAKG
ncbi:MAG TPA: amidohydrolase family protein, partial [Pyrinomonadaceae bacterium]|nr:amidohydrolase family protein [Pyrinomonadaceae bacterium]